MIILKQAKLEIKSFIVQTLLMLSVISIYHYIPHKWIVIFARADWLARRWLAKCYSPPSSRRKTKWLLSVYLWAASYSAFVVYTKTIIHLSVGESGGYLPPLWWIIVKYQGCALEVPGCQRQLTFSLWVNGKDLFHVSLKTGHLGFHGYEPSGSLQFNYVS